MVTSSNYWYYIQVRDYGGLLQNPVFSMVLQEFGRFTKSYSVNCNVT